MCLYERSIENPKYQPNTKNGGRPPKCNDYRQLKIRIGCGWCEECRKELANEWRIRLTEETKQNDNLIGVTLSFSPESINKLESEIHEKAYKGIEGNDTDVNLLASYAVRMWSERWRKRFKRAPKHWLITELGEQSSERIHLHGLVWNETGLEIDKFKEAIEKSWGNGNIRFSDYWGLQTINYFLGYVTKLDPHHKGYKQRIFTSKKMGIGYLADAKRIHKFRGEKTVKYYKATNGCKLKLPKYYKQKLWTEEEREMMWSWELDKDMTYIGKQEYDQTNEDTKYVKKFARELKGARKTNELAGYGNHKTQNEKYIITDAMRMHKDELLNLDKTKLVKKVCRRKIEKIILYNPKKNKPISKGRDVDSCVYGEYQGTTTQAERDYNELLRDARVLGVTVRQLRLIKNEIFMIDEIGEKKWFDSNEEKIKYYLTRKKYRL